MNGHPDMSAPLAADHLARLREATSRLQLETRLREGAVLPAPASPNDRAQALEAWIQNFFTARILPHFKTGKAANLQQCLPVLLAGSGQPIDLGRLMQDTDVARLTVGKLVDCIEHTGAFCILKAFHGGDAKEMTQFRFGYFLDSGLVETARIRATLPPLDTSSLWRHAVVTALRLRFGSVHYWRERKGPEMPCVVALKQGRPDAYFPDWDATDFDPEPFRAFRVLHPLGQNFCVVPEPGLPPVQDAYGLPVHTLTLDQLLRQPGSN